MSKKKINLAIIFPSINDWLGGLNYFINLITALKLIQKKNFNFKIFSSIENKKILKNLVPKKNIVYTNSLKKFSFNYILRKVLEKIYKNDIFLEKIFMKYGINIISHNKPFKNIKSICWIPDLQHKILKKNFNEKEILQRDKIFENYLINGTKVITSSKVAKNHLIKSYKHLNIKKVNVLNFVPLIKISKIKNFSEIKKKYNLPLNYFFCPNQFWVHKNHKLIIDAVNHIKNKKVNFKIIFSGSRNDYRNHSHILSMIKKIKKNNLSTYFIFLDKIIYEDVISIMYYSNAIINPSTFEGWSTTVEEGKLLKKIILLSKIDTHLEQMPKYANYFDVKDHKKLSQYLLKFSKNKKLYKLNSINRKKIYYRKKFAENYYKILKDTLFNG